MNPKSMSSTRHIAVFKRKTHVAISRTREAGRVLRSHGVMAAAKFGIKLVRGILHERLAGSPPPPKSNAVDRQFGTDTAENVKLHGLDITSPNYQHAIYYRATDFPILLEILKRPGIRHEDYTF